MFNVRAAALRGVVAVSLALWMAASVAVAAPLVDEVRLVADATASAGQVLSSSALNIPTTGSYTITVTDLMLPAALATAQVAVTNSLGPATIVSVTEPATAGASSTTQTVTLAAGNYTLQPLGTVATGSFGSFSVMVTAQGAGAPLYQNTWDVSVPGTAPPAGESTLFTQFTVSDAGNYQLNFTDQAFPAPLQASSILILPHGAATPVYQPGGSNPFALAAGVYDLVVAAKADATALAGLYSLQIIGGGAGNTVAYATTMPVGKLPAPLNFTVPQANDTVTLHLNDLLAPAQLASLKGVWIQGGAVLLSISAAGAYAVAAGAGPAQLYLTAQPGASAGEGAYAAFVTDASGTLLDSAQPVVDSAHSGFVLTPALPVTAGTYQLSLSDIKRPSPLANLTGLVEQDGAVVSTNTNPPTVNAQAGPLNILAFASSPAAGAAGLFSVQLTSAGTVAYQATQAVGASFHSETVHVPAAGNYLLQLTDFAFPVKFGEVWLITTSGPTLENEIVGGGKVTLTATAPGDYVLNVLAQVGTGVDYGLYGMNLDVAPPAPAVTLTASVANVSTGGTATLTWSASNATSCTASGGPTGGPWSGTVATSGTQATGALNATTTFSLSCTGDGGSGQASVTVSVTAPASKGGGGAFGGTAFLMLLPFLWRAVRRRRATGG